MAIRRGEGGGGGSQDDIPRGWDLNHQRWRGDGLCSNYSNVVVVVIHVFIIIIIIIIDQDAYGAQRL